MPAVLQRHNISDEELELLGNLKRDGLSEAFWGFLGAALSAIPGICDAVFKAYLASTKIPMTFVDVAQIVIFVGCFCVAATIKLVANTRDNDSDTLIAKIRARNLA